jgi:hypothetical protein
VESAQSFDEFAIAWLGPSYDAHGDGVGDLPLSAAQVKRSPAQYDANGVLIKPSVTFYSLGYGTCDVANGSSSCRIPLTLVFYPPCGAGPAPPAVSEGKEVFVRGIDAQVYGGGRLQLDTTDFTVTISPPGETPDDVLNNALRIAGQLEGANSKAGHLTKDRDFTPLRRETCPALPAPPTPVVDSSPVAPFLVIDADSTNEGGPCAYIDAQRTISVASPPSVAFCLVNPELPPLHGRLLSLTLVVDYGSPLVGSPPVHDLSTDLNSNPDWNENVSTAAGWDCNVLNMPGTAPRAATPARIVCDSAGLEDQQFLSTEYLGTLSFEPVLVSGTSELRWNAETELVSGSSGFQCDDVSLHCVGATIITTP